MELSSEPECGHRETAPMKSEEKEDHLSTKKLRSAAPKISSFNTIVVPENLYSGP
jgi:hypothetical protein